MACVAYADCHALRIEMLKERYNKFACCIQDGARFTRRERRLSRIAAPERSGSAGNSIAVKHDRLPERDIVQPNGCSFMNEKATKSASMASEIKVSGDGGLRHPAFNSAARRAMRSA